MEPSDKTLSEIALTRAEYEAIIERLQGRTPNALELGMFGALWSEHCGYKHTKLLLRELPSESERVLVKAGEENAGAVLINPDTAIVFKIESHNHPSAVEPYQGAATGVGGIVRDILAMGARPIVLMNSLRFGPPTDEQQRHLLNGVIAGIADYGNLIGVPNVGGEIMFDKSYSGNPLVNAMCVGLIESNAMDLNHKNGARINSARAFSGDRLLLVGAKTGRDGIHGASGLASQTLGTTPASETLDERASVQIGNPFFEKCLIEACLLTVQKFPATGVQDCGAAGITSAVVEMAANSGTGITINVDQVPLRDAGMTAYEIMLSETQERMLLAVPPGEEQQVIDIFNNWEVHAAVIGEFGLNQEITVHEQGNVVGNIPIKPLVTPKLYTFNPPKPALLKQRHAVSPSSPPITTTSLAESILKLLASPNIASKKCVWQQYDHMIQNNTVVAPGSDAAVLRLKGLQEGLAITTDGNARFCYLDPRTGGQIAVAEACRNLSVVGAEPIAITDGLNFGNPENDYTKYEIHEVIWGIKQACEALTVPVISGNASLYNETPHGAIMPTPIVGALGLLPNVQRHATAGFVRANDTLLLLGTSSPWDTPEGLPGSEYAFTVLGQRVGKPVIDLNLEKRVQALCRESIQNQVLDCAHDCSDGGLAVAVAECAIAGNIGTVIAHSLPKSWDAALFGESQSRVLVAVRPQHMERLKELILKHQVPYVELGTTGGNSVQFGHNLVIGLEELADAWNNGFALATGMAQV